MTVAWFSAASFQESEARHHLPRSEANGERNGSNKNRHCRRGVWRVGRSEGSTKYVRADYLDRPHKPPRIPASALPVADLLALSRLNSFSNPPHSTQSQHH